MDISDISHNNERMSSFKGFAIATRFVELEHPLNSPEEHRYGASFAVRAGEHSGQLLWRRVPVSVFSTAESAIGAALQSAHNFVDTRLKRL